MQYRRFAETIVYYFQKLLDMQLHMTTFLQLELTVMNVVRRNVLEAWAEYFYIFDNNITVGFYDLLKDYIEKDIKIKQLIVATLYLWWYSNIKAYFLSEFLISLNYCS